MPASVRTNALLSQLNMRVRILGKKPVAQRDNRRLWSRNPEVSQECGRHPLVHQDASMLGIIRELNNVKVAIGRFDQMRLGSAAHSTDQAARVCGHVFGK